MSRAFMMGAMEKMAVEASDLLHPAITYPSTALLSGLAGYYLGGGGKVEEEEPEDEGAIKEEEDVPLTIPDSEIGSQYMGHSLDPTYSYSPVDPYSSGGSGYYIYR